MNTQPVLNGGLDPWGVGSATMGRPICAPDFPPREAFSLKLGVKMGRPNFADPTQGSNPPFKALCVFILNSPEASQETS